MSIIINIDKQQNHKISYKAKTTSGKTLRWFPPLSLTLTHAFDSAAQGRVTL